VRQRRAVRNTKLLEKMKYRQNNYVTSDSYENEFNFLKGFKEFEFDGSDSAMSTHLKESQANDADDIFEGEPQSIRPCKVLRFHLCNFIVSV